VIAISRVLLRRAPVKVLSGVVCSVVVFMQTPKPIRARANKGLSNKVMDLSCFANALKAKRHRCIAFVNEPLLLLFVLSAIPNLPGIADQMVLFMSHDGEP